MREGQVLVQLKKTLIELLILRRAYQKWDCGKGESAADVNLRWPWREKRLRPVSWLCSPLPLGRTDDEKKCKPAGRPAGASLHSEAQYTCMVCLGLRRPRIMTARSAPHTLKIMHAAHTQIWFHDFSRAFACILFYLLRASERVSCGVIFTAAMIGFLTQSVKWRWLPAERMSAVEN